MILLKMCVFEKQADLYACDKCRDKCAYERCEELTLTGKKERRCYACKDYFCYEHLVRMLGVPKGKATFCKTCARGELSK